jgi:dephospho-CoA kinase
MLKVALTGGIATGKSYVRARIAAHGVAAIDADAIVHELLGAPGAVTAGIERRFGRRVVRPDGTVDRQALGAIVFTDGTARRHLEAILHPPVYDRIASWMAARQAEGAGWALADIPLLFETGREADFDRVIVASCDPEEQVRRVMRRDGLPDAAARARVASQWPIAEKVRRASDVVDTGGTFADTDRQVEALWEAIERAAGAAPPGP